MIWYRCDRPTRACLSHYVQMSSDFPVRMAALAAHRNATLGLQSPWWIVTPATEAEVIVECELLQRGQRITSESMLLQLTNWEYGWGLR